MNYSRTVKEAFLQRISECGSFKNDTIHVINVQDHSAPVSFYRKLKIRHESQSERVAISYAKKALKSESATITLNAQIKEMENLPEKRLYQMTLEKLGTNPRDLIRYKSVPLLDSARVYTYQTCNPCSGHGVINCTTCGGTSVLYCGCGNGRNSCSGCGGSGSIQQIVTTNVSNWVSCSRCHGAGTEICSRCSGCGQINCTDCHNGRQSCTPCGGDGGFARANWTRFRASLGTYSFRAPKNLPPARDLLLEGEFTQQLIADCLPLKIVPDPDAPNELMFQFDATAYITKATIKVEDQEINCTLAGTNRIIIDDDQFASKLFDQYVLNWGGKTHNVGAPMYDIWRMPDIAQRMVSEMNSCGDVALLTDVKSKAVTPAQAKSFFQGRREDLKAHLDHMGKLNLKAMPKRSLLYFLRLVITMYVVMIFSTGDSPFLDNLNSGIFGLISGDGWKMLLSGFDHYSNVRHQWPTLIFLFFIGGLSSIAAGFQFGFTVAEWTSKDATSANFSKLSLCFAAGIIGLLSLFPATLCTFTWMIPSLNMLWHAAKATLGTIPTLLTFSVLLSVVFNRQQNYTNTMIKLIMLEYTETRIGVFK